VTIEYQPDFDPRLVWAAAGGTLLARVCPVLVVVDILRFTTAVEVATSHGAQVVPERWPGREADGGFSLSPVSLSRVRPGARVELASPNGATVSLALAARGLDADVRLAAEHDVSRAVPASRAARSLS
jgi:2-phosphosulfolactate phosphatase